MPDIFGKKEDNERLKAKRTAVKPGALEAEARRRRRGGARDSIFESYHRQTQYRTWFQTFLSTAGGHDFDVRDGLFGIFHQVHGESVINEQARHKAHPSSWIKVQALVATMILLNLLKMGFEVDYNNDNSPHRDPLLFGFMDFFFSVFFTLELLLRLHLFRWSYFADSWNILDFSVVVLSWVDITSSMRTGDSGGIKLAAALRVVRLFRIVHAIKGVQAFYGLWVAIQGMLDAGSTMVWILLLLIIITYCLGVILTTVAGHDEFIQKHWVESEQYVGTVYRSMITVMQVTTLDGWASDVARPLMGLSPTGMLILFCTIFINTLGVVNIIIAVMVEHAILNREASKKISEHVLEKTEQALLQSMAQEFVQADIDNSGELDREEFSKMVRLPNMIMKLRLLQVQLDEADSLFSLFDVDGSGTISPEEFVAGLQRLRGNARGQDIVQLISFAEKQQFRAQVCCMRAATLHKTVDNIKSRLIEMGRGMSLELTDRTDRGKRKEKLKLHAAERQVMIQRVRRHQYPKIKFSNSCEDRQPRAHSCPAPTLN